MTDFSNASLLAMERAILQSETPSRFWKAEDWSWSLPSRALSEPEPSVLSAGLIHGIGSLTPAEKQIVGAIMSKIKPRDVLAAMREAVTRRQQQDDEKHRRAWQFLDDPSLPNPWAPHKSYPPTLTFEPEPSVQMQVPVNSRIEKEPVFQFLDDAPTAPTQTPRSGYHAGPTSWRFKAEELDDAMFHFADGETCRRKPINKNFDRKLTIPFYMCQWNAEKRWLTHDVNYRFDFWYTETDSHGRVTHHFTEV
jgi:hypothetical protein